MPLAQDNHVVETLTTNRSNEPFDERVLPRRTWRRQNLLDFEPRDTPVEVASVDLIAVPQQVTRRRVPGKGVNHLLRCPPGRRMFRHVEMNDTATVVAQHDEDKENTERCGRHREQVYGDQLAQMIVEKAPPDLGRRLSMPNHVFGHRGLGDVDSDLAQLAVYARSSPPRVGFAHLPDQCAYLGIDGWTARPTSPALPRPIASET